MSDVGPAGSLAAQLAERFSLDGASSSVAGTSPPGRRAVSGHRRPHSDASSISVGAAPLPASAGGAGMQQVLDSSADPLGMAMIPGGLLFGNAAAASATAGTATGTGSASRSVSRGGGGPSASPPTANAGMSGLSLPDPFRGSSPGPSYAALPDVGLSPAQAQLGAVASSSSSVSMDGAIMAPSTSATANASLGVLADALNEPTPASPYTAREHAHADASTSGSGGGGAATAAGSQRTSLAAPGWHPTTQSRSMDGIPGHTMPGGLPPTPALMTPGEMPAPPAALEAPAAAAGGASTTSSPAPKRLSFFSYSDILNHAPGHVLDFDGAVRASQSMDDEAHAHAHAHAHGAATGAQALGLGIAAGGAGAAEQRRTSHTTSGTGGTSGTERTARASGEALR
jgi:hypothetical protein